MSVYCVLYEWVLCSLWMCTDCVLYECVLTVFFINVLLCSLWMCTDCFLMNVYWLGSLWMSTVFIMNVYCLCSLWVCTDCVLYECVLRSLWMCTDCVLYECVLTEAVKGIVEFPHVWRYFVTLCSRLNRLTRFCPFPHFLSPPRQWLDLRNDPRLSRSDPCHPIDPWTLLTFSVPLQTP